MGGRDLDYSPAIQAYFDNPERSGTLQAPPEELVVGRAGTADQGAVIEFQLQIINRRIQDASYRVYGCPHTIAVAGWVTDQLVGSGLDELDRIQPKAVVEALDLPVEKMGSVLLAEDALASCIRQWRDSNE